MEIDSNLKNVEIEEALAKIQDVPKIESRIRILWGLFKHLNGDKEFEKTKLQVMFGSGIYKFDIRKVIYGEIEEYHDSNHIKIKGLKKLDIYKYWDELENRERIMKKIIESQYDEGWQREMRDEKYDK